MARTYHVLVVRDDVSAPWRIEFGSWVRDEVAFERDDYRDGGSRASDLKVVTCDGRQSSIEAIVDAMNNADRVARLNAPAR